MHPACGEGDQGLRYGPLRRPCALPMQFESGACTSRMAGSADLRGLNRRLEEVSGTLKWFLIELKSYARRGDEMVDLRGEKPSGGDCLSPPGRW
jgi:hypothetical protein